MNNPHRQHFNEWCPEPQLSRGWLALYCAAILACWTLVSTMDYRDARKEECERKTTAKFTFTYQHQTDTCRKEKVK
jgi:hypothetical protein